MAWVDISHYFINKFINPEIKRVLSAAGRSSMDPEPSGIVTMENKT